MEKEELNRLILEQIEKISDNVEFQNDDVLKQEGAELCQAQPAKHKLFGFYGAIFLFELLMVVLLNCWIVELLIC